MIKLFIFFLLLLTLTQTSCPCGCATCKSSQSCRDCGDLMVYDRRSYGCLRCNDCTLQNCCYCANSNNCQLCKSGFNLQLYNNSFYRCVLDESCQPSNTNNTNDRSNYQFLMIITIVSAVAFLVICVGTWIYLICKSRLNNARLVMSAQQQASLSFAHQNSIDLIKLQQGQIPVTLKWSDHEKPIFWEQEICRICMKTSVQMQTTCQHYFHFFCFRDWSLKSKSCFSCRQEEVTQFKVLCSLCKASQANVNIDQLYRPIPNTCDQCTASGNQ